MNGASARTATMLAAVSVATAAGALALRFANEGSDVRAALPDVTSGAWAIDVLGAIAWCLPGVLIARRRPDLIFGWLALVAGIGHGLAALGLQVAVAGQLGDHHLPGVAWGLWFASWGPAVELPVLAVTYVIFPEGRRMAGWWGRLSLLAPVIVGGGLLLEMLAPFSDSFGIKRRGAFAGVHNPLTGDGLTQLPPGVPFIAAGMLIASATVLWRWYRARGAARGELHGLAFLAAAAPVVVIAVLALPARFGFAVGEIETFLEIAVITAVVLQHQLFGIEVTLHRFAVYTTLIFVIALGHATIAAIATSFTSDDTAATIATIVVALGVLPARDVLNRAVTQLLYGSRDDPIAVLAAVSRTSTSTDDRNDLLRQLALNVATMMRLPFVAIEIVGDEPTLVAEVGARRGEAVHEFPLVHRGEPVGVLQTQPRRGEDGLATRDVALLEQVAVQASIAVAAMLMSIDVQRSRQRLVVAVEDERRRLRRDLHDGLGPSLTASTFRLDTARALLRSRVEEADQLIGAVRADVATALNDIRRLVYDLRPPALDDLGLIGALSRQLDVPSSAGLQVSIDAPAKMPSMSAAVEVAAYRIVMEAVTNVRRHSSADCCRVVIRGDDHLRIEVCDDGAAGEAWTAGVGLMAMSERSAEVGGTFAAGPTPYGGRVEACLPLTPFRPMTDPPAIRVIVADDHPIVRSGLRALLDTLPDVRVIDEAEDGQAAIDQAALHVPDVVIMDIQMPGVDGIQAVRQIMTTNPRIGILMLTMFEDDANVFAAVQAGARGYLLKGATHAEVANAIRAVHAGQVVFGAALAVRIAYYFNPGPASIRPGQSSGATFAALTVRENQILTQLAEGQSNGAIARHLGISAKTVANHVSNILTKLQTADRAQAIIRARSAGLGP